MNKILIVDDELDLCELYEKILTSALNVEIDISLDGLEAFINCVSHKYDLIITDQRMPMMNGAALIQALKSKENLNKTTPVILISGHINAAFDLVQNEAVTFLHKPISIEELLKNVRLQLAL